MHSPEDAIDECHINRDAPIFDGVKVLLGGGYVPMALGQVFQHYFVVKIDHRLSTQNQHRGSDLCPPCQFKSAF